MATARSREASSLVSGWLERRKGRRKRADRCFCVLHGGELMWFDGEPFSIPKNETTGVSGSSALSVKWSQRRSNIDKLMRGKLRSDGIYGTNLTEIGGSGRLKGSLYLRDDVSGKVRVLEANAKRLSIVIGGEMVEMSDSDIAGSPQLSPVSSRMGVADSFHTSGEVSADTPSKSQYELFFDDRDDFVRWGNAMWAARRDPAKLCQDANYPAENISAEGTSHLGGSCTRSPTALRGKSGFLWTYDGFRRWFLILETDLLYFDSPQAIFGRSELIDAAKGRLALAECAVRTEHCSGDAALQAGLPTLFITFQPSRDGKLKTFKMVAKSCEDALAWEASLKSGIARAKLRKSGNIERALQLSRAKHGGRLLGGGSIIGGRDRANTMNRKSLSIGSRKRSLTNRAQDEISRRTTFSLGAAVRPVRDGPLFEQFSVVGLGRQSTEQAWQHVDSKSSDSKFFPADVLFSFRPENETDCEKVATNSDVTLNSAMASFCFPRGCAVRVVQRTESLSGAQEVVFGALSKVEEASSSFVFLITSTTHLLYGVCVVVDTLLGVLPSFVDAGGIEQRISSNQARQDAVTSVCYCIVSQFPFIPLFFEVLYALAGVERLHTIETSLELLGISESKNCTPSGGPVSSAALDLIFAFSKQPVPKEDEQLAFSLPGDVRRATFRCPEGAEDRLLASSCAAALFKSLTLDSVCTLFQSLLLERSVVFVGQDLGAISSAALAILALIRPFVWQGPLIPILPNELLDILDAPVPFICGVQSVGRGRRNALVQAGTCVVSVDDGDVICNNLPRFPGLRSLRNALQPLHQQLLVSLGGQRAAALRHPFRHTQQQIDTAYLMLDELSLHLRFLIELILPKIEGIIVESEGRDPESVSVERTDPIGPGQSPLNGFDFAVSSNVAKLIDALVADDEIAAHAAIALHESDTRKRGDGGQDAVLRALSTLFKRSPSPSSAAPPSRTTFSPIADDGESRRFYDDFFSTQLFGVFADSSLCEMLRARSVGTDLRAVIEVLALEEAELTEMKRRVEVLTTALEASLLDDSLPARNTDELAEAQVTCLDTAKRIKLLEMTRAELQQQTFKAVNWMHFAAEAVTDS